MIPLSLYRHLEALLGSPLSAAAPVAGGDTHHAFHLRGADGQEWFLKTNASAQAVEMFRTEALGLALLGASQAVRTPRVRAQGQAPGGGAYLLLEYVPEGYKNRLFWETFGRALAALHGNTSAQFGFAHDNFIGALPQSNTRHATWAAFYAEERLWPQFLLAREAGHFDAETEHRLERLCRNLAQYCPEEPPALTHGDLWSGNFRCDLSGRPVLIDPAACFAHRETDLAMSRLFGGFDAAFYAAYAEASPLEPGFERRLEIYQLYYLLVHVNLFGGGYVGQVRGVLEGW